MKILSECGCINILMKFSHLFSVGSCSSTLVEWNMLHSGWGSSIVLFLCHYRNCLHQHLTVSPGYGSVHLLLPLHTSASEPLLTPHYRTDILHLASPSMHCTRATGPAPVILGMRALRTDRRRSHIPTWRLVLGQSSLLCWPPSILSSAEMAKWVCNVLHAHLWSCAEEIPFWWMMCGSSSPAGFRCTLFLPKQGFHLQKDLKWNPYLKSCCY